VHHSPPRARRLVLGLLLLPPLPLLLLLLLLICTALPLIVLFDNFSACSRRNR
jgi:hypothetical protein